MRIRDLEANEQLMEGEEDPSARTATSAGAAAPAATSPEAAG